MDKNLRQPSPMITEGKGRAPVSVRLKRINCDHAQAYPPESSNLEKEGAQSVPSPSPTRKTPGAIAESW